jgi:hypothetical protein
MRARRCRPKCGNRRAAGLSVENGREFSAWYRTIASEDAELDREWYHRGRRSLYTFPCERAHLGRVSSGPLSCPSESPTSHSVTCPPSDGCRGRIGRCGLSDGGGPPETKMEAAQRPHGVFTANRPGSEMGNGPGSETGNGTDSRRETGRDLHGNWRQTELAWSQRGEAAASRGSCYVSAASPKS